jgi:hypothetical protein
LFRHRHVCVSYFAAIAHDMFALEFDQLDESRMLAVHRSWK